MAFLPTLKFQKGLNPRFSTDHDASARLNVEWRKREFESVRRHKRKYLTRLIFGGNE
jgi:hypothetical protein